MAQEVSSTVAKAVPKEKLQGEPTVSAPELMAPEPEAASCAAASASSAVFRDSLLRRSQPSQDHTAASW